MKFEFGPRSGLSGRRVNTDVTRIVYAIDTVEGDCPEYILAFSDRIPTSEEEPDLYEGAIVEITGVEETTLRYAHTNEIVLLLTVKADDLYRKYHSEIVGANELLRIDE
ncbi:MAG: hypothetical protein HZB65_05095 [Candidatus Aenigmarchaeota archaeon]|nr:hypothetical protein [Candidatus Aenigmarchaeota archaeon]